MRMQPRREAAPCVTSALTPRLTSSPRPAFARGGKHCLLRWTGPRGEAQVFAVPGTPGDWRSVENTRHDLRKVLRADGMLDDGGRPAPPPRQPCRLKLIERRQNTTTIPEMAHTFHRAPFCVSGSFRMIFLEEGQLRGVGNVKLLI